jgi:ribosome modulation factor
MAATHSKESTMSTNITNRIAAAAVALGAGAAAVGLLAMAPAAQASPMTFAQACTTTHGWVATVVTAGIEECHWQDPNTGNEWIRKSPIGAPAMSANGATPFAQACVITQGWNAVIVGAGKEQCHWQDPDGNEHIVTSPLPKKPQVPSKVPNLPQAPRTAN